MPANFPVPSNAPPGGSWFVQTSPHPFPMITSIRDAPSGLELDLKATDRLVYICKGNQCFDVVGNPVEIFGALTPLREGLIPIVTNSGDEGGGNVETQHILSDSADCRPIGTLAGGTWYRLYNEESSTVEPVYCEEGSRYYTRQGLLLDSKQAAKISEKWTGRAPVEPATTAPKHSLATTTTSSDSPPASCVPPGAKPGGVWLQQEYSGRKTSDAANLACCYGGIVPAVMVHNMKLDQRLVYKEPGAQGRFIDRWGRFVNPRGGNFTRLPFELSPTYVKTGIPR